MQWVKGRENRWHATGLPTPVEAAIYKHSSGLFQAGVCVPNNVSSQCSWRWENLKAKRTPAALKEAWSAVAKLLRDEAGARLLQVEQLQQAADALIALADTVEA